MKEEIIKLKEGGKSVREIAQELNISVGRVQRVLNKSSESGDSLSESVVKTTESVGESVSESKNTDSVKKTKLPTGYSFGRSVEECPQSMEVNELGIIKVRACDYTKKELKAFPGAPYWVCSK